jgi:hypothetical protein
MFGGADQSAGFEKKVGKTEFVKIAIYETQKYFHRYAPQVISQDNTSAIITAAYRRYPVKITIKAGDEYRITVSSTIEDRYIDKWIANLEKNVREAVAVGKVASESGKCIGVCK